MCAFFNHFYSSYVAAPFFSLCIYLAVILWVPFAGCRKKSPSHTLSIQSPPWVSYRPLDSGSHRPPMTPPPQKDPSYTPVDLHTPAKFIVHTFTPLEKIHSFFFIKAGENFSASFMLIFFIVLILLFFLLFFNKIFSLIMLIDSMLIKKMSVWTFCDLFFR